ncbi:hypothetical protein FMM75_22515 [Lachnospiraceae bacterium MD335]|nr:hypothetical protein [Lachnospiraceae bacterium MD335]
MEIINFEEAKARKQSKARKHAKSQSQSRQKVTGHLSGTDNGVSEPQRQYQELARFYNQWYGEHVIGQDENGGWIYKD